MLRNIKLYRFSIAVIKQLKEITGSPINDCKKALEQSQGDIKQAVEYLKEKGLLKAEKKLSNKTGEGVIGAIKQGNKGVFAQINCETDFVARTKDFLNFSEKVIQKTFDRDEEGDVNCEELEEERKLLISRLQENISINKLQLMKESNRSILGVYTHNTFEGSIFGRNGCIVELVSSRDLVNKESFEQGSKNVAISMLGMKPEYINRQEIGQEEVEKQKQLLKEGIDNKNEKIVERIIEGKMKKWYEEKAFLEMQYILDEDLNMNMEQYIQKEMDKNLKIGRYVLM